MKNEKLTENAINQAVTQFENILKANWDKFEKSMWDQYIIANDAEKKFKYPLNVKVTFNPSAADELKVAIECSWSEKVKVKGDEVKVNENGVVSETSADSDSANVNE